MLLRHKSELWCQKPLPNPAAVQNGRLEDALPSRICGASGARSARVWRAMDNQAEGGLRRRVRRAAASCAPRLMAVRDCALRRGKLREGSRRAEDSVKTGIPPGDGARAG